MRVVFCGTPDFALPSLRALVDAGFEVPLVVSQPDKPRGRGKKLSPTPVRALARELGLENTTLERGKAAREALYARILDLECDAVVVVAFGHIVREPLLNGPRLGCVNVHASLLPRWRGPAPIHRAIVAGDASTGVCTMRLAAGVDTGDTYLCRETEIGPNETTGELHDRLAQLGAQLLAPTLRGLEDGSVRGTPQDHERATHAPMLHKREGSVDFARDAARVHDRIRGFEPWPGVTVLLDGRRLRLAGSRCAEGTRGAPGEIVAVDGSGLHVACGRGVVCVGSIQPEGRRSMRPIDFARGAALRAGQRLLPLPDFVDENA